jgi:competence protein ComEA
MSLKELETHSYIIKESIMKLSRQVALLLLSVAITLGTFPTLSLAQDQEYLPINLNSASAVDIAEAIDGVGEVRAAAIIALREQLGGFTKLEQLLEIKGISEVTLSRIRSLIVLE